MTFVRFRSPTPNRRGARVGIFAVANGLRARGALDADELSWLASSNAWMEAAYAPPPVEVFDRARHPIVECWYRASARTILERVDGYLALLDAHGEPWERIESNHPGQVVYEDSVQIVVAPDAR